MDDYSFAQRLRSMRKARGWTQVELQERSGVHHMAISRLERGDKKDVKGTTVRKLALALSVSSDWLLGLTDERSPAPPCRAAQVSMHATP